MSKLDLKEFVSFLTKRCNKKDGYIMGAVGQDPKTIAKTSNFFRQYAGNQADLAQALYWRENAERVWDCQGLSDGYVSEKLGVNINVRARNNYDNWCSIKGTGKPPKERRVPGCAVFIYSSSLKYITHIGYLEKPINAKKPEGDWYVVEARGVRYGVVRTKLSERGWNRWGWMTKYFDYGTDRKYDLGERELQKGCEGPDVTQLQLYLIQLGHVMPKYGADGEFGNETVEALKEFQREQELEVDGIFGAETWRKLQLILKENIQYDVADYPEIKKGSEGKYVEVLQTRLIALGYGLPMYGADGDFGKETHIAVVTFQYDNGLEQDGIVGQKTWQALYREIK